MNYNLSKLIDIMHRMTRKHQFTVLAAMIARANGACYVKGIDRLVNDTGLSLAQVHCALRWLVRFGALVIAPYDTIEFHSKYLATGQFYYVLTCEIKIEGVTYEYAELNQESRDDIAYMIDQAK